MGTITKIKVLKDDKMKVEMEISNEEFLRVKGHTRKIYLLTENLMERDIQISARGAGKVTKYFLCPKNVKDIISKCKKIGSQVIQEEDNIMVIYHLKKEK
jgi:hypothetical protein